MKSHNEDLYQKNQYCMKFNNRHIVDYLVDSLEKNPQFCIRLLSSNGNELEKDSKEEIEFVCFDGKKESFYIRFIGHKTLIYVLNEEFMFIDDDVKINIVSSDTYHNVVYEGTLRDKTQEEMMDLFKEFINILKGAKTISIREEFVSQEGVQYPKYNYVVDITNDTGLKSEVEFGNILFIVNAL